MGAGWGRQCRGGEGREEEGGTGQDGWGREGWGRGGGHGVGVPRVVGAAGAARVRLERVSLRWRRLSRHLSL